MQLVLMVLAGFSDAGIEADQDGDMPAVLTAVVFTAAAIFIGQYMIREWEKGGEDRSKMVWGMAGIALIVIVWVAIEWLL